MNKSLVAVLAIVVAGGFLAGKSFVSAADKAEPVQPSKTQAELKDEAKWEAWRDDFAAQLDKDSKYRAAEKALLDVPLGDEYDDEYAQAEAVLESRYREIGRASYEEHFGAWTGDDAEFDDLLATARAETTAAECAKAAVVSCGRGKICSWVLTGDGGCSVICQDGQGGCAHTTAR